MKFFTKSSFLVIIFFLSLLISPTPTEAATVEVEGFAWSSNIGWISMNCLNAGNVCQTAPYKVLLDTTTGDLTGYAWSSNIGWIKFGGLASDDGFPNTFSNAQVDLNSGQVTGWVRACAGTMTLGTPPDDDCPTTQGRSDGWDGWISLSGANYPSPTNNGSKGVTYFKLPSLNKFIGFAWGSEVVGWINFDSSIHIDITGNPTTSVTSTSGCGSGGCPRAHTRSTAQTCNWTGTLDSESPTSGTPLNVTWTMQNMLGNYQLLKNGNPTVPPKTFNITTSPYNGSYLDNNFITNATYTISGPDSNQCSTKSVEFSDKELKLLIGASQASFPSNYYAKGWDEMTVVSGRPFAIKWNVSLSAPINESQYTCVAPNVKIDSQASNLNNWNEWKSRQVSPTNTSDDDPSSLDTVGVPAGQYIFSITCSRIASANNTSDIKVKSVKLNVTQPSIREI